jgi:hypothetical protein
VNFDVNDGGIAVWSLFHRTHIEIWLMWTISYLGSVAAGVQAGAGNVAAGSLLATTQSAAMGGRVPAVVTVVGTAAGAGAVAAPKKK